MARFDSKDLDPTENQAAVGATETEVIFQRVFNVDVACGVGTIIQIAFWILVVQVDGGGHFLMVQGQDCENTFNATRTTQQVPGHGLGGADQSFLGVVTQSRFDGIGFIDITQGGGGAVGVQVAHLIGIDTRIAHG